MNPEKSVREYRADELAALVPLPAADANKYTRGTLTAVVGSERYPGAACLAAAASQRAGAGYTEVVTHPTAVDLVRAWRPSLVVLPRACLVGCGFDVRDEESGPIVRAVLEQAQIPVVVDGSGLDALACEEGRLLLRRRFEEGLPTVVTPHAGEAARLARPLGLPSDDPCALARSLSLALGVIALVKGPVTYASDGDEIVRMTHGTPALAKAGTGDVLAGLVGALLAQGADALDAAVLGAELHARAGRIAAARLTDVAVVAEDVLEAVPHAIAELLREA